jgi:branched-subunit amino acid aminotransferase/4-amino-4-deoxychorismate lyase
MAGATIFVNGEFVEAAEARISALDAGLQHGVGIFETMTARVGGVGGQGESQGVDEARVVERVRVVHLDEHMRSLQEASRELGLLSQLRLGALGEAIVRTCARAAMRMNAGDTKLRVRVTLTGGDLNLLSRGSAEEAQPTLIIVAQRATAYPSELFEKGARVVIGDLKINPLNPSEGYKTLAYWPRLRELQRAAAKGADEALIFQVTNFVAGGCVSNVVLVKDDVVLTPISRGEEEASQGDGGELDEPARARRGVLPSPVRAGVTRKFVLDCARGEGRSVVARMLAIADVLDADEVMLTNSSWGVLPVTQVEGKRIGDGNVGKVSRAMMQAWNELCG